MKQDKKDQKVEEAEVLEEKTLTIPGAQDLDKPKHDAEFAQKSAVLLMDIVAKNGWAKKLGQGDKAHLQYEAWQTVGKFYGYTVKTSASYVEYGTAKGFEGKAIVVNELTGQEVGAAESLCMNDEANWKTKPLFQLKSMAQTRAGAKALRQILGFVVALAGYSPTPKEEIEEKTEISVELASIAQLKLIHDLLRQKNKTKDDLEQYCKKAFGVESKQVNKTQAYIIIKQLAILPDLDDDIDLDSIDAGIKAKEGQV